MKFAPSTARRAAAASLAAAALFGASACSAINYQATTHAYSASDGVKLNSGDIKLRHIAFIASEESGPARLIGLISNSGSDNATVQITAGSETFSFSLQGGEAVNLEHDEELIVPAIGNPPGSIEDITVSVNGAEETLGATVLDGALEEYRALLPDGFDTNMIDHLEHGPDTWGGGAAHYDPEDDGH